MSEKNKYRIDLKDIEDIPVEKRCSVAVDVALNVILAECGNDKNLVVKELGELLGVDVKDMNPVSEHCKRVFDVGLTENTCRDFRFIRAWVMCEAWRLLEEENLSFRNAIRTAWRVAKDLCAQSGVVV